MHEGIKEVINLHQLHNTTFRLQNKVTLIVVDSNKIKEKLQIYQTPNGRQRYKICKEQG